MVRCFLSFLVSVLLFSKVQDVLAAKCSTRMGLSCSNCGDGTRCIQCSNCLCFCFNPNAKKKAKKRGDGKGRSKRSTTNVTVPDYGNTTVQYKKPLIELFEDLYTLIKNDEISNIEVVELYKSTSSALSEDCQICNDVQEIEELRNLTRSIHEELEKIMMSENITTSVVLKRNKRSPSFISLGSNEFKKVALEKTSESNETAYKIPGSVLGKVGFDSIILDKLGKLCNSYYIY